ncbi:MAG TPA: hypothetical protein VGG25_28770 [Streptosporangiaceae bacterium]|jgi:hypothetical protein
MAIVALIIWLATAGAGLYLLAVWLIEYDRDFQGSAATRLPVPVIGSHALLAVAGLGVWSTYLLAGNDRLAWLAVAILGCAAVLGLVMAMRWLGVRRSAGLALAGGSTRRAGYAPVPPERHFPVAVVVTHGIFAAGTVIAVLLTAFGIGSS